MIALAAILLSDLFAVVMLFGVYSLLTAALFMDLDAVDVAFTEAAVGAGVTTVLMLSSLHLTRRWEALPRRKPLLGLLVIGITGAALVYAVLDAPLLGDPTASYRGYDTFGETVVIFTAGLAVLLLLGIHEDARMRPGVSAIGDQVVLRSVVKPLLPLILIFGLYVQFHGDFGAGGGFQAGVIFATAFVLYELVFGEGSARAVVPPGWLHRLAALGVLIYGGVGVYSLLAGKAFLDYSALATDPVHGQHLGILLVELGVGIAVFSVVLLIFYAFSGRSRRQ
jgi:multicomponent Na+:H+ antiporter subunit B